MSYKTQLPVAVTPEEKKRITAYAVYQGLSRNALCRGLLREGLEWEPPRVSWEVAPAIPDEVFERALKPEVEVELGPEKESSWEVGRSHDDTLLAALGNTPTEPEPKRKKK
jgi:hypothetical protein